MRKLGIYLVSLLWFEQVTYQTSLSDFNPILFKPLQFHVRTESRGMGSKYLEVVCVIL